MKKIIWVARRSSLSLASFRYRTLFPAFGIEEKIQNIIVHKELPKDLTEVEAVVFNKAFNENSIEFAYHAHQQGIKIFLDLCDNIFIDNYAKTSFNIDPNYGFLEMIPITSGIITTTSQLKETIQNYLPKKYLHIPFLLSPDGIETAELLYNMRKFKGRSMYKSKSSQILTKLKIFQDRVKRRLKDIIKVIIRWETEQIRNEKFFKKIQNRKENGKKIVLWYGNAGNEHFGLSDLKKVIPILEIKDLISLEHCKVNCPLIMRKYDKISQLILT